MRKLFLIAVLTAWSVPGSAVTIDRVAAVVDRQVITVSEVSQMVETRFFPRAAGASDDEHRRTVLENLIAQALRYRDVERFGAQDIGGNAIEARLQEIERRFGSPAELHSALQRVELTADEFRALIRRQLQVEAYIQERFAPLIFISNDDIETYYRTTWSQQRRERGLAIPPLDSVREEIRTLLRAGQLAREIERWTAQLRLRANVDVYAWR